jgi:hypothetical protein
VAPWPRFMLPGPLSVKVGALIVRAMVVVAFRAPEVPVMVRLVVPPGAEALTASVSTLVPEAGFVLHEAVTPLGNPDTARLTLPLNPY